MNCCAGEDEAGGCILIETNLPNANAADSSIAGCIFSLTHNICLVFCVSTQCSKRQSVLSNRRGGTGVGGRRKNGCLLWNPQCLNHAKTLESRGERQGGVMWCWARTWRQIKVDGFGPSRARSLGCLWERMRGGGVEAARPRGDSARLFCPTVMWPTGAGPPLLCVGLWRGREGGREGWGGRWGGGQYRHLSLSEAGVPYRTLCVLKIMC